MPQPRRGRCLPRIENRTSRFTSQPLGSCTQCAAVSRDRRASYMPDDFHMTNPVASDPTDAATVATPAAHGDDTDAGGAPTEGDGERDKTASDRLPDPGKRPSGLKRGGIREH